MMLILSAGHKKEKLSVPTDTSPGKRRLFFSIGATYCSFFLSPLKREKGILFQSSPQVLLSNTSKFVQFSVGTSFVSRYTRRCFGHALLASLPVCDIDDNTLNTFRLCEVLIFRPAINGFHKINPNLFCCSHIFFGRKVFPLVVTIPNTGS